LLITWLIQPIKEEVVGSRVVVVADVEETEEVKVIEALVVVVAVVEEETAVDVEDVEKLRRRSGFPSPSLVAS